MATKSKAVKPLDPVAVRKSTGLNQQFFWGQLGVTQSGGSRYEHARKMPKPVEILMRAVYVHNDLSKALKEVLPTFPFGKIPLTKKIKANKPAATKTK